MKIELVKRKNIDTEAWDNCIKSSVNRRIYAMSWYLDAVSNFQWDAFVCNRYQTVMPLPYTKKFGVKFYIQPIFCQQLGVFWTDNIDTSLVQSLVNAIPGKFHKICMTANVSPYLNTQSFTAKPNYILPLSHSYDDMLKAMSKNHQRNIKKVTKHRLIYKDISIKAYIDLKKSNKVQLTEKVWQNLHRVLSYAEKYQAVKIRGAFYNHELIATVCWLKDFDRMVYLQAASNENGRKYSAAFGLIQEQLIEKANSNTIIDFEGSKEPSIARFYKGFGAIDESYPCIESHWMKKLRK